MEKLQIRMFMDNFQYYMLNGSIKVPKTLQKRIFNSQNQEVSEFDNLSKINFLVGANNSGKSYLSRELYKNFEIVNVNVQLYGIIQKCVYQAFPHLKEIEELLEEDYVTKKHLNFEVHIFENDEASFGNDTILNRLINDGFTTKNELFESFEYYNRLVTTFEINPNQIKIELVLENGESINLNKKLIGDLIDFIKNILYNEQLLDLNKLVIEMKEMNILINHLRYLSFFSNSVSMIGHFENIYNLKTGAKSLEKKFNTGFDFNQTVVNSFIEVDKFQRILEFQKFLSESFFDNEKVYFVQTNNLELNGLNNQRFSEIQIQIGKENPKFIQLLGTGIQMLIILTWPLFENDYGTIFIEEPELYLHPRMQRKLMEIYATHPRSSNFQFFISTHSNHILDYTQYNPDLTSIYKINKRKEEYNNEGEPTFNIEHIKSDYRSLLFDLGVTNTSVFLANCTIWVEGITDVKYIRTYMKYYSEAHKKYIRLKENLDFMFVPYGGLGNLYNWDFDELYESHEHVKSAKLSNSIYMLADKDIKKSSNLDTLRMLETHLQDNFHVLPFDCIEKTLLGFNEQAKESYSKYMTNMTNMIDKQSKVSNFNFWLKKEYLKDKRGFANKQIKKIDQKALELGNITADNLNQILSSSAIDLCEKIYNFIEKSNQN